MMRRGVVIAAGLALVLTSIGCVRCIAPRCHLISRDAGPECEIPHCCRDRVYAFLVGGLNPLSGGGLDEIQGSLLRHGFSKVGRAGCYHGAWILGEMARIRCADTEARFVIVGLDVGATTALRTASRALEEDLPVDAVVMLDPIGSKTMKGSPNVRTILLLSHGRTVLVPYAEVIVVPDASPFDLAAQPTTLATIVGVMEEVALAIWSETPDHAKFLTWDDNKLPSGPLSATSSGDVSGDWSFLNERVGGKTPPLPVAVIEYSSHP